MQTLLIAVICFAAYATGAVTGRRVFSSRANSLAHPSDLLFVSALLTAILYLRPYHPGPVYFLIGAASAFLGAIAMCKATAIEALPAAGGTREYEEVRQQKSATHWSRWLNFSRAMVDFEFRLLLLAVYFVIIGPVAIAFRFLRKGDGTVGLGSAWIPKNDSPTLDSSRRAF